MDYLRGVYPAVLTAFDELGKFAPGPYEAYIDHLYAKGIHGLYVCGVSGEGLMMSPEERERVAEVAVAASRGRGHAVIHVGCGNTADAVRLARHASRIGASAVGCLAPYTGSFGLDSLIAHYTAVAEAAHPLPTLIYYTPQVAPSLGSYAVLECLLDLPGIAGVKFTGTDASELACAIFERSGKQTVLTGVDEMFLAALLMGAHGGIGSFVNLVPELFLEIYRLACAGCWEQAKPVQRRMIQVIRIVERFPFLSALKNVVRWQGFDLGEPRQPHARLTAEQQRELRDLLSSVFRFEGA